MNDTNRYHQAFALGCRVSASMRGGQSTVDGKPISSLRFGGAISGLPAGMGVNHPRGRAFERGNAA